jgi:invasion protein IalB
MGRTAAVVIALALAGAGLAGSATAQQPAPPAKKAPAPPAAAKKDTKQAAPAPDASQSAWVKLCEKATAIKKDKDKEEKRDLDICLTHHERLDGNTGMVLVSAAVRQIDGQDKQHFMVMVPLGMLLQPGMRASLYPKDIWDKVTKNEKVDESKLKQVKLAYTLCHPAGCTAEMEMTPDLLNDLKTGGGLVVFAVNAAGQPVGFPVPLSGFEQSYAGKAIDNKQYGEARRTLMQQIAQRQQQIAEEQQKKAKEEPKAAPSAPPAKAAPAPAPKK